MDIEYAAACAENGVSPEVPSLWMLFTWADIDGSGKATLKELSKAITLLAHVSEGVAPEQLSHSSWQKRDEDGNGILTFVEFAGWAGPRLGLPLGEDQTHRGDESCGCGILCCPCSSFQKEVKSNSFGESAIPLCAQCGHKEEAHFCNNSACSDSVAMPLYWGQREGNFTTLVPTSPDKLEGFQQLLDKTTHTCNRKDHDCNGVPRGFRALEVQRNENSRLWTQYALSRAKRTRRCAFDDFGKIANVHTNVAMASIFTDVMDQMTSQCNEWYLFYGTSRDAAHVICKGGFRMMAAGACAGTLHGRGIHFAESITRADQFASDSGSNDFTVLLCRVLGGHVKYLAEAEPDRETSVSACTEGPYHCILSDRECFSGSYRDFVIFDTVGVYPEYAINYSRIM